MAGTGKRFEQRTLKSGLDLLLPTADVVPFRDFVGREDLIEKCEAAWLDSLDYPSLHFRLTGPPGVGKNELVYHLARRRRQALYIMHGHEELTPEDIACTARIVGDNRIEYVGSPLLSAMFHGGICFFDEIGKVPSRSLSLLASVLDDRRTLSSVLAGFSETADQRFRFCAAMNEADAQTSGLPGYIDERLRPEFKMPYPPVEETLEIVRGAAGKAHSVLVEAFRVWVSRRPCSPRSALAVFGYAARLAQQRGLTKINSQAAEQLILDAANHVDASGVTGPTIREQRS